MLPLHQDRKRLEAFRRGDRDVLTSLYTEHNEAVEKLLMHGFTFMSKGTTMRFGGFSEPFRLQEAIQESFLKAFSPAARTHYDGTSPWRPYLLRIARNHTLDLLRRAQLESRYISPLTPASDTEKDAQAAQIADPLAKNPELEAIQSQLSLALQDFLASLDPLHHRLITEHLAGNVAQRQMADALGISRNDLRREIATVRHKLLQHLKAAGLIDSMDPSLALSQVLLLLLTGGSLD